MTDPEDLLPAVLAAPDDDLPRLVYADALEETGVPGNVARAEFIRVQIELVRNPGRKDLVAREATLLAVHGDTWLAPLRRKGEALENMSTHGQFRRGFVEVVWMPAAAFVKRGEVLFERAPVRELRVLPAKLPELRQLLRCNSLSRLKVLVITDRKLGNGGAERLSKADSIRDLRILRLRACNISDAGALVLAARRRNLQELDLSLNPISPHCRQVIEEEFGDAVVLRFDPPLTDSIPARHAR